MDSRARAINQEHRGVKEAMESIWYSLMETITSIRTGEQVGFDKCYSFWGHIRILVLRDEC